MEKQEFKIASSEISESPFRAFPELVTQDAGAKTYHSYLQDRDVRFITRTPNLLINEDRQKHGQWMLHISVIKQQMGQLLSDILDVLVESGCAFSIPQSDFHHNMILDGSFGVEEIGKIITIWPYDTVQASSLADYLIKHTEKYNGPAIPAAVHLKASVYTSYGEYSIKNIGDLKTAAKKSWPFKSIATFQLPRNGKWINKRFFKYSVLKNDAKGNVYKGFDFSKLTDIQWCVLKQGKKYQCVDSAGRDIRDRLQWQFKVQTALAGDLPIPKAIDLINLNDDVYFIMQFIEGDSYHNQISSIQEGVIWHSLAPDRQDRLISLALQVIDLIDGMHKLGYLHRDLNPLNFIVTPGEKVFAIDLELSYNILINQPKPFFTLGTPGYMSPEQVAGKQPLIEDDVYGIGAILIRTLTGLSPIKFNLSNTEKLFQSINHFINNKRLSALLTSCLNTDVNKRPTLSSVVNELEFYRSMILANKQNNSTREKITASNDYLKQTISSAIESLFKPPLLSEQNWLSKKNIDTGSLANSYKGYSSFPDFYLGASGIIYALIMAVEAGYDLSGMQSTISRIYVVSEESYNKQPESHNIGLYKGISGFNVITAYLSRMGWIPLTDEQLNLMAQRFSLSGRNFNLSDGLAGQGFAIMKCAEILGFPNLPSKGSEIATVLINAQGRDGSWEIKEDGGNQGAIKFTGFLNGVSGICYFLMFYGFRQNDSKAKNAAKSGLEWLMKLRTKSKTSSNWPVSAGSTYVNPWFDTGFTGVAFLFISAYQLFKDPYLKEHACESLMAHPAEITSNYISQGTGLAGLGEVYLEAFKVFGDIGWIQRAEKIVDFFLQTSRSEDGALFWLDGSEERPEAAFMTGNAGVIHFLLRYQFPDKIPFPLLSLSDVK
ncbi:protein kinase [Mucilaginibacter rubeus]|uniref:Protein kinase n=1 Tax=Mucilaginibacter rubeus TaxID=2027860 RepID=A0AAE6JKA9_9SPHI|nr:MULTISPECIES: lanthionine synthetase LanC family protein [Mucilaginibacter]QEM07211.1 protein kinase [Mucilaginibacter rubeus]QEM19667.1 protein kinase [Mucilaginibacter gossypii]QTE43637.1 protein kinase [Mucilaginibacter rubeus]QTE50237.1 protein kinase [Mucilaginibacter rubeus]QTE55325.1 protein kinase [Mucilaginibacter rubeus]